MNYFSGEMEGNSEFRIWLRGSYLTRYPSLLRGSLDFTEEARAWLMEEIEPMFRGASEAGFAFDVPVWILVSGH